MLICSIIFLQSRAYISDHVASSVAFSDNLVECTTIFLLLGLVSPCDNLIRDGKSKILLGKFVKQTFDFLLNQSWLADTEGVDGVRVLLVKSSNESPVPSAFLIVNLAGGTNVRESTSSRLVKPTAEG